MSRVAVDVYSDAICPWCWIGKRRLEQGAAAASVSVRTRWHPFQLNPAMPRGGMARGEYRLRKFGAERSAAIDAHITRVAAAEGLAFRLDLQERTPNTVLAHRLIRRAGELDRQDAVVEAIFSAYFTAGLDVGDPRVLGDLAEAAGIPHDDVTACFANEAGLTEVLAEDHAIRARGIEGVPLFLIGEERIEGAQPAPVFAAVLSRLALEGPPQGEDCSDGMCRS